MRREEKSLVSSPPSWRPTAKQTDPRRLFVPKQEDVATLLQEPFKASFVQCQHQKEVWIINTSRAARMYVSKDIMLRLFLFRGAVGEKHARPTIQRSVYMKYTAERVGGEADLCSVRLVCRALWMTWISPPARLHHIVLVPKNWSNTKWISSQSFGAQSRDVASFSRGSLQSWKRGTVSILFCFIIWCQFATNVLITTLSLRLRVYSRYVHVRFRTASLWMCTF